MTHPLSLHYAGQTDEFAKGETIYADCRRSPPEFTVATWADYLLTCRCQEGCATSMIAWKRKAL
jgi:hypothetical protein